MTGSPSCGCRGVKSFPCLHWKDFDMDGGRVSSSSELINGDSACGSHRSLSSKSKIAQLQTVKNSEVRDGRISSISSPQWALQIVFMSTSFLVCSNEATGFSHWHSCRTQFSLVCANTVGALERPGLAGKFQVSPSPTPPVHSSQAAVSQVVIRDAWVMFRTDRSKKEPGTWLT